MIKDPKKLAQRMSILCILIGFIALAVGICGRSILGSNKEYITNYTDIHRFNNEASVKLFFLICEYPCNL